MKLLMHFIDFRTAAFLIWPERRQDSSRNPKGILPDNVRAEIKNLIINSVAPSTSKTYLHGLEIFDKFTLHIMYPPWKILSTDVGALEIIS